MRHHSGILLLCLLACKSPQQHIATAIAKDPTILKPKVVTLDTTIVPRAVSFEIRHQISPQSNEVFEGDNYSITIQDSAGERKIIGTVLCDTITLTKEVFVPQIGPVVERDNYKRPFYGLLVMFGLVVYAVIRK